ncbi:MAG: PD40 domain-containing protein [Armatimonadetes bacterium]|nr:PD40 domain-containing protein [Armatimonadota bacterium]
MRVAPSLGAWLALALSCLAMPVRAAEPAAVLRDLDFNIRLEDTPFSTPVPIRPAGDFTLEVHVAPKPDWTPRKQAIGIVFYQPDGAFYRASAMHWNGWYTIISGATTDQMVNPIASTRCPEGTPGFKEGFRLTVTRTGKKISATINGVALVEASPLTEAPLAVGLDVECLEPLTSMELRVARVTFQPLAAGPGPEFDPDGRVAYARTVMVDGKRCYQIFLAREDGSEPRQLTQGETDARRPAMSPDGQMVAYEARRERSADIYILPTAGGSPVRVTTGGESYAPRWAPDGKHLLYCRNTRDGYRVFLAPAQADGEQQQVEIAYGRWADWSPDATEVTSAHFVKNVTQYEWRLLTTPRDEKPDRSRFRVVCTIPSEKAVVRSLAWSPDGIDLLFTLEMPGGSEMYAVGADGKLPRRYPLQAGVLLARPQDACWSPDGSSILYAASLRKRGSGSELYVMTREGRFTRLFAEPEGDADYADPDWWRPGYVAPLADGMRVALINGRYQVRYASSPQIADLKVPLESDFRLDIEVLPNRRYQPRRQMVSISFQMANPNAEVCAGYLDFPEKAEPGGAPPGAAPWVQIKGRQGLRRKFTNLAGQRLDPNDPTFATGFTLTVTRRGRALAVSINGKEIVTADCLPRPLQAVRLCIESEEVQEGPVLIIPKVIYRPLAVAAR